MDHHHALLMLSVRDRAYFTLVDQDEQDNLHVSELTAQQAALARLAALVALDGAQVSFMHVVEEALSAGASVDDLVGTLIAVMPSTGADRVVSAAPKLALALGYGSLYNHSYKPNATYKHGHASISYQALRNIPEGEEICINYNWDPKDMAELSFKVV